MKDASTKDILENIRKQLEAANNNLKQAAEKGELEEDEGDFVNLNSETESQKIEEPTDEVRIEERTPEKEKEEVLLGLAAVKQNLQAEAINNPNPMKAQEESLEPDEDEDWEFLEDEDAENEKPEEEKIDAPMPEIAQIAQNKENPAVDKAELHHEDSHTPHEEEINDNLHEEDLEEEDPEEEFEEDYAEMEDEHSALEEEDPETTSDLAEEEDLESAQHLAHSTAKPYTYYEKDEVHKIPDYANHEIIPEAQIANEIADKISASLSNKFAKMLDDAKALKASDAVNDLKVKDLVLEALPSILEKWIDKNQNLILNTVEKVAEKNISAALSRIKF